MDDDFEFLSLKDVAKILNLHPKTLYKFVNDGTITGHRLGRTWLFVRSEVVKSVLDLKAVRIQQVKNDPGSMIPGSEHAAVRTGAEENLELARSLRGKFVRFNHQEPVHRGYLVTGVTEDGMIELQGMAGQFAPHLFVRVGVLTRRHQEIPKQ